MKPRTRGPSMNGGDASESYPHHERFYERCSLIAHINLFLVKGFIRQATQGVVPLCCELERNPLTTGRCYAQWRIAPCTTPLVPGTTLSTDNSRSRGNFRLDHCCLVVLAFLSASVSRELQNRRARRRSTLRFFIHAVHGRTSDKILPHPRNASEIETRSRRDTLFPSPSRLP